MVVEGVVCRAVERLWDSTAKEERVDDVASCVGLGLIKREEDESIVHKIGIVKQRGQPVARPVGSNGDRGIVAIVSQC